MKILITGGNGRLGRWVGRDLRDHDHEVISIDRQLPATPEPGILYRAVELNDLGQISGALVGCEAVLHFGAIPAPWSHPDEVVFRNNVVATYNVLQAAMLSGIQRAIIASSGSAYGMAWSETPFPPQYVPVDEAHPLLAHEPYALSKEVDERTAEMFVRRCGVTILAYRFHWISLPGEAKAAALALNELTTASLYNLSGYVDIRDAAQACRLGLTAQVNGFQAYNIGAADTLLSAPTAEMTQMYLPATEVRGSLPGYSPLYAIGKAQTELGYQPQHTWRDE